MAGQAWYKLCELTQRFESLRYQHQCLLKDLDELLAILPTISLAIHDLEPPSKAVTMPIARAIEVEPVRNPPEHPTTTEDPHCPHHSGKN